LTTAQARRALARAFSAAGLDTPELDARILVAHALGLDHTGLAAAPDRRLDADEVESIGFLAARRLRREPVARILGEKEFWGLPIRISAETLVPRPETETVVEAALDAIAAHDSRAREIKVADLGTGSGALLCALLHELPNAFGVGSDLDARALKTAGENAGRLGFRARARFVMCNFGAALAGPFDLVVSNPPYVKSEEIDSLSPEVREHDPRLALDGGQDGLASYRAIAADAKRLLAPRGHLIVEIGAGQAHAAAAVFCAAGLGVTESPRQDLAGRDRALHIFLKC
jgi:release factor glutamine methyltransferase